MVHHASEEQPEAGPQSESEVEVITDSDQGLSAIRPTFTITDAATACSVSRKTITRKLPELAGYGAAKDDDGVWRIPVEALLAVGLHPGRSRAEEPAQRTRSAQSEVHDPAPQEPGTITISRDRWDDVRIRLARAEAEAAERALALADARLALRALTAGPSGAEGTPTPQTTGPRAPTPGGAPAPSPVGEQGTATSSATPAGIPQAWSQEIPAGSVGPSSTTQQVTAPAPQTGPRIAAPSVGPPDDIVAARNRAAQNGGYVPVAPVRPQRRRWWQSSR